MERAVEWLVMIKLLAQPYDDSRMWPGLQNDGIGLIAELNRIVGVEINDLKEQVDQKRLR